MCKMIGVKHSDGDVVDCETVQELADALRMRPDEVSDDPADYCLCNAFIEKLGARKSTDDEGWPWPELIIEIKHPHG